MVIDRHCVIPQVHINQYDNSRVSYADFKARSYVDWDDFWTPFDIQSQAKKWPRRMRMRKEGQVYACRIYYYHLLRNSLANYLIQHSVCKITSVRPCSLYIKRFYDWNSHIWWWRQPQRHCNRLVTGRVRRWGVGLAYPIGPEPLSAWFTGFFKQ